MSMRVLVTRPREDSERLAGKLEALGHEVLIEPLFTIQPDLDTALDLDGVQALLFTSANGARAFALRSSRRDIKVLAVGDATAAAAREFGFGDVESADGDVDDLARLVRARLKPEGGAVLHAAGSVVAGDLAGTLGTAGFDVRRAVLYRAEPVGSLSDETTGALRAGRIDLAVFFSPRTARTFVSLARAAGLEAACTRVAVVGLSPAVVAAAADLPWRAREAAERPTEASLIEAIARHGAESAVDAKEGQGEGMTETPQASDAQIQATSTPASPAPPAAARGWVVPVALATLLALVALAWSAWREFAPRPDPSAARADQLEQRVSTLEGELASRLTALDRDLTARFGGTEQARGDVDRKLAAAAEQIANVETRLGTVAGALESLTARVDQIAQESRDSADPARLAAFTAESRRLARELARLQEEVASLNSAMGERSEVRRNGSLVLALGQLREAVARGAPYDAALQTFRAVAEDMATPQDLSALDAHAKRGIPTRAELRLRFDRVATEVARHSHASDAGTWWGPMLDRVSSLIAVRRVGEVDGDSPAAILARAENRLAVDDLAGAVVEIEKLSGGAAAPATEWLADARARLDADAVLSRLAAQTLRTGSSSP